MELIVTAEFAARAKNANACSVPDVGTPVSQLTFGQLAWAEAAQIITPAEKTALGITVPLWCLSGSGDGSGDGDGDGSGNAQQ